MEELSRGAEAVIYLDKTDDSIVKIRGEKGYRIPDIDHPIRRQRTRSEAKILEKLKQKGIPGPALITSDDKASIIRMENLKGDKLRNSINRINYKTYMVETGKIVGRMHDAGIIHGDLTTSNIIAISKTKVAFIDFGLSFISDKIEDMAVDIHLFRQALESKHNKIWNKAFNYFISGYNKKRDKKAEEVLKRLEKVESRGRNKKKK